MDQRLIQDLRPTIYLQSIHDLKMRSQHWASGQRKVIRHLVNQAKVQEKYQQSIRQLKMNFKSCTSLKYKPNINVQLEHVSVGKKLSTANKVMHTKTFIQDLTTIYVRKSLIQNSAATTSLITWIYIILLLVTNKTIQKKKGSWAMIC